ncbi:MAG: tetratricopeptide repeat protein [Methanothrix sp.]|nr:tetratricopeptide repeat protein [Methanothrix sp.]MDD4446707.1 tetratricopeptide repeat protein [Methanothrix sp.]
MTKGYCLVVLMLLIGSCLMLPASSQEQVSQTVYVYDGDFNGTLLSGVQVAGQDAAGKSFSAITDSNGVAVVSGQPGTWLFVFIKDGYETLDLSYNVTETDEGAVYLVRSNQPTGQVAPSLNNQQPEAISKANTAYKTQLETNATSLVETELNQDGEGQNPTKDSQIQTASSQDQVSQTVYVYDGDFNGTFLSDVQVAGQDAAGMSFGGITDSNGVAVVSGQPGTWQFVFTKDGYETLKLSYNVTETGEGAVYLVRSNQLTGQIVPDLNNQQPVAIPPTNTTDETQLDAKADLIGETNRNQEQELQDPTVSQNTAIGETETASAEYWLEYGNVLYGQGRYDEAAKSYDRCILLDPQLEAALFNKGNALYMQGDYDNALSAFDKAIEINPQDANTWICRGLTLKKLGRTLEANTAFMQAKELGYAS